MLRTTPEAYALYLMRTGKASIPKPAKQPRLDHVPSPQEVLAIQLRDAGIAFLYDSFHFHPRRDWRVDIAISTPNEEPWLLIECDGGTFLKNGGGHNRGKGYEDDRERDAEALALGFVVLRCTPRQVLNMKALTWIQRLIAMRETA